MKKVLMISIMSVITIVIGSSQSMGPMDISEGDYKIKSTIGDLRYLDLDEKGNGEAVRMKGAGPTTGDITWRVRKIRNAPLGGYTLQNVQYGSFLDAEYLSTEFDGCKVQGWERTSFTDSRNQEWYIKEINIRGRKLYRITNVKSPGMAVDAGAGTSNTKVALKKVNTNISVENGQIFEFKK